MVKSKRHPGSETGEGMENNQRIEELKAQYNREYIRMVNDNGVITGKNNWDVVFRSFVMEKLAELECKLESLIQPPAATVTA